MVRATLTVGRADVTETAMFELQGGGARAGSLSRGPSRDGLRRPAVVRRVAAAGGRGLGLAAGGAGVRGA